MHPELRALLGGSGVLARADVDRSSRLDGAVGSGEVERVHPRIYVESLRAEEPDVLVRAGLRYAGDGAVLSHTTGLDRWDLPLPTGLALHVTRDAAAHRRSGIGLVVHRSRCHRRADEPCTILRRGLPTHRLERCLVESWPVLRPARPDVGRAPLVLAVRGRLTTPARVLSAARSFPKLSGLGDLRRLLELLAGGCHSELEMWGHEQVFVHPSLPAARSQLPVRLSDGRLVYLDRAFETELVDVELDGSAYHSSREQRARDERRDTALATLGWLPLRFGYDRLHADPAGIRAELRAILERRRHQFGLR